MPKQNGMALDFETDEFDNPTRIHGLEMKVGCCYAIANNHAQQVAPADTATNVLFEHELKAGLIEKNDTIKITPVFSNNNNANNKIWSVIVGGVTVWSRTRTTTTGDMPLIELRNRNSLNSQIYPQSPSSTYATGTAAPATFAIDFSVNQKIQITAQKAVAGDTMALESVLVEIIRSAS